MKELKPDFRIVWPMLILFLLFQACYEFDFVIQPFSIDPDSTFEVEIGATIEGSGQPIDYIPYFGIMLPEGWTVQDSIEYACDTTTGIYIYSETLSIEMDTLDTPPLGYYWWVSAGTTPIVNSPETYFFNPLIITSSQTGTFFLDYMLGSDATSQGGINWRRSNDHVITVGLPDSLTVTNANNNGPGSLRRALNKIDFYGTITVELAIAEIILLEDQLSFYKDISLIGPEDGSLVISGQQQHRVLYIHNNRSPYISNLSLIHGNNESGGGIYCDENSSPVFQNVSVSFNSATGDYGRGGGIYCRNSSPKLLDVRITGNTSDNDGGGIYCYNSNPEMQQVTINYNEAKGYGGGGMYCVYESYPVMQDVTLAYNTADFYGGGIYCHEESNIEFDSIGRCNVYLNNAYVGNDLFSEANLDIFVDTFSVLYPTPYFAYPFENFTFDIWNGKMNQVSAEVYVSPSGDNSNTGLSPEDPLKTINYAFSIKMPDSLLQYPIHLSDGIYSPSSNEEIFPVIVPDFVSIRGESENSVILDAEGQAGVMQIQGNQLNLISNLTITGGQNYLDGGGVYCVNSSPVFDSVTITNNYSYENGGGLFCMNGNTELHMVSLLNNSANRGGGIYFENSSPTLEQVTISGNSAVYDGGGISCENSNLGLLWVNISGNSSSISGYSQYGGGGVHCSYSDMVLKYGTISNNGSELGGGIACIHSNLYLENSTISNNIAEYGGGMHCSYVSYPLLINCALINNTAFEGGGGFFHVSFAGFVNGLISGNSATMGGGMYATFSHTEFLNTTISGNSSEIKGGIYSGEKTNLDILNSILWDNDPYDVFYGSISADYEMSVSFSDLEGGEAAIETTGIEIVNWLEGNIDEHPQFVNGGEFPFALSDESPCINSGNPDTTGLYLPMNDLAGNPRFKGGRIDMGAFENQDVATSIHDETQKDHRDISIYPNPSINDIIITLDNPHNNYHLTCFNTFGQQVYWEEIQRSETTINVSTWQHGIYLAVLYEDGRPVGQAKFVVQ